METLTFSDYVLAGVIIGLFLGMLCTLLGLFMQKERLDKKLEIFFQEQVLAFFSLLKGCAKHPWDAFNVGCEAFRLAGTILMAAGSAASLFILGSLQYDYIEQGVNDLATFCGISLLVGLIFFSIQCSWVQVACELTMREFNEMLGKIYPAPAQEPEDPWTTEEGSDELPY